MKYKALLENWNRFLSKDLLAEVKLMKQKDAVSALSEVQRYQEDSDDFFLSIEMIKDPAKWKVLSKYMNILVQEEVPDDEKFSLSQKLQICYLHGESIFPNMDQAEQNDLLEGYYSVWELEEELGEIIELKGLKKSVGGYFAQKSDDAEILYRDENLVVVKPLTTVGSIVWGRGMSDGSRERDAKNRGPEVDWCTTVSGENYFKGYIKDKKTGEDKNRLYYIIKDKSIFRGSDVYRKICVGITNVRNKVTIDFGNNTTVDASNIDIFTKNDIVGKTVEEVMQMMVSKICAQTPELVSSFNNAIGVCVQDAQSVKTFQQKALDFSYDKNSFVEELADITKSDPSARGTVESLEVFESTYKLLIDFLPKCNDEVEKSKILNYFFSPAVLTLLDEYDIKEEISVRTEVLRTIFDGRLEIDRFANSAAFINILASFIEAFQYAYTNELLEPTESLFSGALSLYEMIKKAGFKDSVEVHLEDTFKEIDKQIKNVKAGRRFDYKDKFSI